MRKKDFYESDVDAMSVGPRLNVKNIADSGATVEIKRGSNSLLKMLADSKMDLRAQSNGSNERRKSLQPHGSASFSLKQN